MKTVLHISTINENTYDKYTYMSKIIDKFKIKVHSDLNIKEINTILKRVDIPANLNKDSYKLNLNRIVRKKVNSYDYLSLNGNRIYDLKLMNRFQLDMISYSIIQSLKYIFMNNYKSIKTSKVLVDIDEKILMISVLEALAIECRNVIILTNEFRRVEQITGFILANYGIAIEVICKETDIEGIDFVVTTKNKEYKCKNVWYVNNYFMPRKEGIYVDSVLYRIPWNIEMKDMPPQLIGLLVKQDKKKSISEILESNEIRIQSILFKGQEAKLL